MKKLLVVLLALGLIAAFGMPASAADVKFSGQYYVMGAYDSNRDLNDTDLTYSKAYFFTRTRIQTVFQVAEGLSLTTRFDALEKGWGRVSNPTVAQNAGTKIVSGPEDKTNSRAAVVASLQESIEFEDAYLTFMTAFGKFDIGYQDADVWGTGYANTPCGRPRAIYTGVFGPVTILAVYEKWFEGDQSNTVNFTYPGTLSNVAAQGKVDADTDTYALTAIYKFKGGDAGLLYKFFNSATTRLFTPAPFRSKIHYVAPYMKATFGPVYVEAELAYLGGKAAEFEGPGNQDKDKEGYGAYALARMNMGPLYFGGQFGWTSGDDGTDATKDKGGPVSSTQYTPCLIWGNYNLAIEAGKQGGHNTNGANINYNKTNMLLAQGFVGFNPTPKINLEGAVTWIQADKKPVGFVSKDYGWEADIKATYKIYDNLTYMVGAGYFWTGDFYKGASDANKVGNDYTLMNQLTLNF